MTALFRGRYRYVVALLLFAAATINYIDRQSISIAERELTREFALTINPGSSGSSASDRFAPRIVANVRRSR